MYLLYANICLPDAMGGSTPRLYDLIDGVDVAKIVTKLNPMQMQQLSREV